MSGRRSSLRTGTQPRDAEAFVAFDRRVRSLGAFLARVQATEPPDLASPSLADATGGLTLLNGLRHLGRQQLREALRVLPMSVADLVDEAVENEALRGVLGARGVRYTAMGPRSQGTALNFLGTRPQEEERRAAQFSRAVGRNPWRRRSSPLRGATP